MQQHRYFRITEEKNFIKCLPNDLSEIETLIESLLNKLDNDYTSNIHYHLSDLFVTLTINLLLGELKLTTKIKPNTSKLVILKLLNDTVYLNYSHIDNDKIGVGCTISQTMVKNS